MYFVLDEHGRTVEVTAVRPDADAIRTLVARMAGWMATGRRSARRSSR